MRNTIYDETPDVKFEESWFFRVLKPHKTEIAEIREAYKLLLAITELFKQVFPSVDSQLSTYYIDLFALAERNKKTLEDKIYDRYAPNANNGRSLPDAYIHTDIFSDFYKPFTTLYETENLDLDDIQKRMYMCYDQIDTTYHKYHADKLKKLPHQKLFNAVKKYISAFPRRQASHNMLECNGLVLDLKRGTIKYKTNPPKEISVDNQAVRFLILLMQNKGDIIEYKNIAKELQLNFYHDGISNEDAAEDTRYLKRDLHSLLRNIGMPDDDFKFFITTQKNVGYKLNCD